MAEFTGETKMRVLDLLSVIVMLDTCDPDYTICTFWKSPRPFTSRGRTMQPAPTKHTWCLKCVILHASRTRVPDKAALIEAVKAGEVNITALGMRDDVTRCGKCRQLGEVNKLWLDELQA